MIPAIWPLLRQASNFKLSSVSSFVRFDNSEGHHINAWLHNPSEKVTDGRGQPLFPMSVNEARKKMKLRCCEASFASILVPWMYVWYGVQNENIIKYDLIFGYVGHLCLVIFFPVFRVSDLPLPTFPFKNWHSQVCQKP